MKMEPPPRELKRVLNTKKRNQFDTIRNQRRAQKRSITDRTMKFTLTNVQASMVKGNN